MTQETPLDTSHAAMEAAPQDDAARLRFYERLADSELFLMLEKEAEGDTISPALFETPDGTFALVFDREDRLAEFAGQIVPYAALSGRMVVQMLAGQNIGLGVNLDVAPSAILIPADAVTWLQQTLGQAPAEVDAEIESVTAPRGLPEVLISSLDTKLATAVGLARSAYLVGLTYQGGGQGHMLGFVDAVEGAEPALAKAVGEALTFWASRPGRSTWAFSPQATQWRVGWRGPGCVLICHNLTQPVWQGRGRQRQGVIQIAPRA